MFELLICVYFLFKNNKIFMYIWFWLHDSPIKTLDETEESKSNTLHGKYIFE